MPVFCPLLGHQHSLGARPVGDRHDLAPLPTSSTAPQPHPATITSRLRSASSNPPGAPSILCPLPAFSLTPPKGPCYNLSLLTSLLLRALVAPANQ